MDGSVPSEWIIASYYGRLTTLTKVASLLSVWPRAADLCAQAVWKVRFVSGKSVHVN